MNQLPCGKLGEDCINCNEETCDAPDHKAPKHDAMNRVSIRYECISDIEESLLVVPNNGDDYVWPWPLDPTELKVHLNDIATEVCTDKQATIVRLRHRWDKERAVGFTFKQIAEVLGVSIETVRQQYHAALRHIKEALLSDPVWSDYVDLLGGQNEATT